MAENRRWPNQRRPAVRAEGGGITGDLTEDFEASGRVEMQRGVTQLLFNYLPNRTVDWEDGLAIVHLEGVRLSGAWDEEKAVALLEEISQLLDRWKTRGGRIDPQFPDPRTERSRFTVGLPEAITATVLETALICSRCSRLSFPNRNQLARIPRGQFRCEGCGARGLRQIPYVFVHGCGELVPITEWLPGTKKNSAGIIESVSRPIRCPRCGAGSALEMSARSERVKDMKIVCKTCGTQVVDRLTARCGRCLRQIVRRGHQPEQRDNSQNDGQNRTNEDTIVTRIAMRVSRYSASDTYYPQSLSMLRLDRPAVTNVTDEEQALLRRLLPLSRRPDAPQSTAEALGSLVRRLREAEATSNEAETARLCNLITQIASGSQVSNNVPENAAAEVVLTVDLERAVAESIAFRETVSMKPATVVARQSGGASDLLVQQVAERCGALGLRDVLIVDDLPVITATFGYTRRSFEPTYEELSATDLPTEIRVFPSVDRFAAQRLGRADLVGTVPILAREGEHEGLFVSLEPTRVLDWLGANGITPPQPDLAPVARILSMLEPVDRYYDDIWALRARRMVFGLVHSLSHMVMRAISRFSGIERTSLSEYIFLPLLGTVIFDSSSTFRMGGIETIARDQLHAFLADLATRATECLYDSACIDHRGACHGCIHSPEISCRVFNHGLSRAFFVGGHAPWADIASAAHVTGYWNIEDSK